MCSISIAIKQLSKTDGHACKWTARNSSTSIFFFALKCQFSVYVFFNYLLQTALGKPMLLSFSFGFRCYCLSFGFLQYFRCMQLNLCIFSKKERKNIHFFHVVVPCESFVPRSMNFSLPLMMIVWAWIYNYNRIIVSCQYSDIIYISGYYSRFYSCASFRFKPFKFQFHDRIISASSLLFSLSLYLPLVLALLNLTFVEISINKNKFLSHKKEVAKQTCKHMACIFLDYGHNRMTALIKVNFMGCDHFLVCNLFL